MRTDINYLASLQTDGSLGKTVEPTIAALRASSTQGGFATDCARMGGGFSAWRLALQQDAGRLVSDLTSIHDATGVAVLVIPQTVEGTYGYLGARQLLGSRLTTSHVLDIGGGSLQVAGEQTSFGKPLGQKIWHQQLCQALRNSPVQPCALSPMANEELVEARLLIAKQLDGIRATLPDAVTMTAISRPVTRGVAPAVERLRDKVPGQATFSRSELSQAIEQVVRQTHEETAATLQSPSTYVAYLLSDMLLVEGLMRATSMEYLNIAELDLTNLPGLLADDSAFRWVSSYGCYLERLGRIGLEAYASDPATCPPGDRPGKSDR